VIHPPLLGAPVLDGRSKPDGAFFPGSSGRIVRCKSWLPMHIFITTTGRCSAPPAPRTLTLRSTLRSKGMLAALPVSLSFTSTLKRTHFSPFLSKRSKSLASIDDVSAPVSSLIFTETFSGSSSPSSIQPNTLDGFAPAVLHSAKIIRTSALAAIRLIEPPRVSRRLFCLSQAATDMVA
jgi:hypothetical protein